MTIVEFAVPPVVKTVSVRAAPAQAFDYFVRDLARWWPLAQFHTGPDPVDCAIEPRAGGRVFERAADGRETLWGTVLAYEPPQAAALRDGYDRGWATLIERCYAEYANTAT